MSDMAQTSADAQEGDYPSPFPLPSSRASMYSHYDLTFDAHGCPMKKLKDGRIIFHPILAAYLISDYIGEFKYDNNPVNIDYACAVADHALKRAEPMKDALIYRYEPGIGLSSIPHAFYSGLTQARHLNAMCELARHTGDRYREAVVKLFNSLLITVEEGGVLIHKNYGWIVEEYPTNPALYTLNGWLTTLRIVISCRSILERFGLPYTEFMQHNLDAAEHLLPLYDTPFCFNSRYQLTGFNRLRLVLSHPVNPRVDEFAVIIPQEGVFVGNVAGTTKNRWENFLERTEPKLLQFNIMQSLISYPEPNRFRVKFRVETACTAKIQIADGDYSPDLSSIPTSRWKQLSTEKLSTGLNELVFDIPFDEQNLFAYPTNFKKFEGKFFNTYHFVHILGLAELYYYSKRQIFKDYTLKWLDYADTWPTLSCLPTEKYLLTQYRYGADFRKCVEGVLSGITLPTSHTFVPSKASNNASEPAILEEESYETSVETIAEI